MAQYPAYLCETSRREMDWSQGQCQALSLSGPLDASGLLPFLLGCCGQVAGAILLGVATRALRSMGWSRTLLASLAALRSRAAARFPAMMARVSGERLAFFAALRLRAADLLLAIRAT